MALPQHRFGGWLLRRNTALGMVLLTLAGYVLDTLRKSYSAIDLPAVVGCYAAIHEAIHIAEVATRKRKRKEVSKGESEGMLAAVEEDEVCEKACVM